MRRHIDATNRDSAVGADRAGERLFRWRSYTPLPLLLTVVAATALDPIPFGGLTSGWAWGVACLTAGLIGFAIRALVLGCVPDGTSGRSTGAMRADSLNTTGAYSLVRHPLYLGNLFIWLGVVAISGRPSMLIVAAAYFWLVHRHIITAEDRFLGERFGAPYTEWVADTPALIPRWAGWSASPNRFSFRRVLRRDYHGLYAFTLSTWIVVAVRTRATSGSWMVAPGWWVYLAAGTSAFCILHFLKRRTRVLAPDDRALR